ncbi:MAG: hypothetical protein OEO77_12475 [Acidimicrobiia bacterium]|nr:hypothetical protein [Acidimicrobiia bacterium]
MADEFEYGFFYETFDENPNVALFAGGTFEEFCFFDPGTAPLRVFLRNDGTVDLKVNDRDQPIYLYYNTEFNGVDPIPTWLDTFCPGIADGDAPPEPFAMGEADLKVRITVVSDDRLEIFNSVNGKATGTDGTGYKVRGTADLIVENGAPLGEPREFVGFKLTEIRR